MTFWRVSALLLCTAELQPIAIVHSMRKEPFDQFVTARNNNICNVEGPAGNGSQI